MSYLTIFTYYFGITLYFLEIILYVVISSISSIIYNIKEEYEKNTKLHGLCTFNQN